MRDNPDPRKKIHLPWTTGRAQSDAMGSSRGTAHLPLGQIA